MKILILIAITLLTFSIYAKKNSGRPDVTKYQCLNVKKDIETNKSRMRQGYGVAEGNRLNAERRRLDLVLRDCKKKRYPLK